MEEVDPGRQIAAAPEEVRRVEDRTLENFIMMRAHVLTLLAGVSLSRVLNQALVGNGSLTSNTTSARF